MKPDFSREVPRLRVSNGSDKICGMKLIDKSDRFCEVHFLFMEMEFAGNRLVKCCPGDEVDGGD